MPYRFVVPILIVSLICSGAHCGDECDDFSFSSASSEARVLPSLVEYTVGDTIHLESSFTSFKKLDDSDDFVQISDVKTYFSFLKFFPSTDNTRGALENFELIPDEGILEIDSSQTGVRTTINLNCDSNFCKFKFDIVPKDPGLYFLFSLYGDFVDTTLVDYCNNSSTFTHQFEDHELNLALFDSIGIGSFDASPYSSNGSYSRFEVYQNRNKLFPFKVVD